MVYGTGSRGPCLDLKRLDEELTLNCKDADLVILEVPNKTNSRVWEGAATRTSMPNSAVTC